MNKDKARGEIRPFAQGTAFFVRRGNARAEEGDVLEALGLYLKATEQEPSNVEAWFRLAETYADMGCYDLSNKALLGMTWRCDAVPPSFFYRLGCNYVALQMYEIALECFRRYTQNLEEIGVTPESEEISELLAAIELDGTEGLFPDGDAIENGARIFARHGERQLHEGDFDGAIAQLLHAHGMAPDLPEITTSLAVAYWAKQRYVKARDLCEEALAKAPSYAKAHCLLAMVARSTGDDVLLARSVETLSQIDHESVEDTFQAAVTLGEVGAHQAAAPLLRRCLFEDPYNLAMMHASAVNAYALRDAALATDVWSKLHRLMPDDAVAAYFDALGRKAKAGHWLRLTPPYAFLLPDKEMKKRIALLKRLQKAPSEAPLDSPNALEIADALLWGLQHGGESAQAAAIPLIPLFLSDRAEALLRDYLFQDSTKEANKNAAMNELHRMGIDGPYLAMLPEGLTEVSVWNETDWDRLPAPYGVTAQLLIDICAEHGENDIARRGLDLWQDFVASLGAHGSFPAIRKPENYAAALAYIAKQSLAQRFTQREAAEQFHAKISGVARAIDAIVRALPDLIAGE